jgi:hypothetical protein
VIKHSFYRYRGCLFKDPRAYLTSYDFVAASADWLQRYENKTNPWKETGF